MMTFSEHSPIYSFPDLILVTELTLAWLNTAVNSELINNVNKDFGGEETTNSVVRIASLPEAVDLGAQVPKECSQDDLLLY